MATEELYEVDRIVDKRRSKKGRTEYLVRWRGYGPEGDTWEPESHLSACMVYIQQFNRQRDAGALMRSTRSVPNPAPNPKPTHNPNPAHKPPSRPQLSTGGPGSGFTGACGAMKQFSPGGLMAASPAGTARRSVDLTRTGIKILVPKSPMNRLDSEESPSEGAHSLEPGAQEAHPGAHSLEPNTQEAPCEVALLEKPAGLLLDSGQRGDIVRLVPGQVGPGGRLGPGQERARMGTRPRTLTQNPLRPPQVPITPAAMRSLHGASALMEAVAADGSSGAVQSAVASAPGKRRLEERSAFDKRLRFSVRQTESAYRYRDIVVKKQDGFTHILLSTKSCENNSLSPEVMKELQAALSVAGSDDSKLVLLGAVGSVFCSGLDLAGFIRLLIDDRKKESIKMAETIRTFVNTFIQFKKPIVAAVGGAAVGLGAALLPLCDVVWANEKAWFQTPYSMLGQTPDAAASFTFPRIMGPAAANEMLLSGRKLTAQEACSKGLVSQVLWPGTFTQEVMLRIRELVSVHSLVLRESKALMRNTSRGALEQANERECEALKRVWGSAQGTDAILRYLQRTDQL